MNKCRFCEKNISDEYAICSGSSCLRKRLDISNIKDQIFTARRNRDSYQEVFDVLLEIEVLDSGIVKYDLDLAKRRWIRYHEHIITAHEAKLKKLEEE